MAPCTRQGQGQPGQRGGQGKDPLCQRGGGWLRQEQCAQGGNNQTCGDRGGGLLGGAVLAAPCRVGPQPRQRMQGQAQDKGKGQEPQVDCRAGHQHPPGKFIAKAARGQGHLGQLQPAIDHRPQQEWLKQPLRPVPRETGEIRAPGRRVGQIDRQDQKERQRGIGEARAGGCRVKPQDSTGRNEPGVIECGISWHFGFPDDGLKPL